MFRWQESIFRLLVITWTYPLTLSTFLHQMAIDIYVLLTFYTEVVQLLWSWSRWGWILESNERAITSKLEIPRPPILDVFPYGSNNSKNIKQISNTEGWEKTVQVIRRNNVVQRDGELNFKQFEKLAAWIIVQRLIRHWAKNITWWSN